jgi:hypothetical protein
VKPSTSWCGGRCDRVKGTRALLPSRFTWSPLLALQHLCWHQEGSRTRNFLMNIVIWSKEILRFTQVQTCSDRSGKIQQSSNPEPHLGFGPVLCRCLSLNWGSVRVRFRFGIGSEPDSGNTTVLTFVLISRIKDSAGLGIAKIFKDRHTERIRLAGRIWAQLWRKCSPEWLKRAKTKYSNTKPGSATIRLFPGYLSQISRKLLGPNCILDRIDI